MSKREEERDIFVTGIKKGWIWVGGIFPSSGDWHRRERNGERKRERKKTKEEDRERGKIREKKREKKITIEEEIEREIESFFHVYVDG